MTQENLVELGCLKIGIYFGHFLDQKDNLRFLERILFLKRLYTPQTL